MKLLFSEMELLTGTIIIDNITLGPEFLEEILIAEHNVDF